MTFHKNTALIIEPRNLSHPLQQIICEFSCKLSTEQWIIVFYCGKGMKTTWEQVFEDIHENIEIRELSVNNLTSSEYSMFCKKKELWTSLYGDFVLVFQLDTFIKNEPPYTIDYFMKLGHSYIGGNMSYSWQEIQSSHLESYRNWNGGLSLRKRQDMIHIIDYLGENNLAEDVYFVKGCMELGFGHGNDEKSSHFAIHTIYKDDFFGGHQPSSHVLRQLSLKQKNCLQLIENDGLKSFFVYNNDITS